MDRFDRDRSRSLGGINPQYRVGPDQDYVQYTDTTMELRGRLGEGALDNQLLKPGKSDVEGCQQKTKADPGKGSGEAMESEESHHKDVPG